MNLIACLLVAVEIKEFLIFSLLNIRVTRHIHQLKLTISSRVLPEDKLKAPGCTLTFNISLSFFAVIFRVLFIIELQVLFFNLHVNSFHLFVATHSNWLTLSPPTLLRTGQKPNSAMIPKTLSLATTTVARGCCSGNSEYTWSLFSATVLVTLLTLSHYSLCHTTHCLTLLTLAHYSLCHTTHSVTLLTLSHYLLCHTTHCHTTHCLTLLTV